MCGRRFLQGEVVIEARTAHRGRERAVLLFLMLLIFSTACAQRVRNPFGAGEGLIYVTVENKGRGTVELALVGLGKTIPMGSFLGGERGAFQFNLEGPAEISVRVSRFADGESYQTFRQRAESGDHFLVELGNDIRRSRLIRTRRR